MEIPSFFNFPRRFPLSWFYFALMLAVIQRRPSYDVPGSCFCQPRPCKCTSKESTPWYPTMWQVLGAERKFCLASRSGCKHTVIVSSTEVGDPLNGTESANISYNTNTRILQLHVKPLANFKTSDLKNVCSISIPSPGRSPARRYCVPSRVRFSSLSSIW